LMAVLVLPWAAEYQLSIARKLADAYLWEKADVRFTDALALDPWNASAFAGYGDFLRSIAPDLDNEVFLLTKAEKVYRRAYELDPMNAEYPLRMGEIEVKLFLKDKKAHKNGLKDGLDYFKKALKNDPNGFNISYVVGYSLLHVWSSIDDKTKELAVNRLRYVLQFERWYWEYIYPWAWQNTKDFGVLELIAPQTETAHRDLLYFLESNNLYQFRKREAENVNFYMKKDRLAEFFKEEQQESQRLNLLKESAGLALSPQETVAAGDWHGRSSDGAHEFKEGNMYWTGKMSAVLALPQVAASLIVQAKGSPADGIYPYMIVELDQDVIGETFVNNDEWKEYIFPLKTKPGLKVVSITFCNDVSDPQKNEDRNLYIGEARIVRDAQ
jgi:hypothetical protein